MIRSGKLPKGPMERAGEIVRLSTEESTQRSPLSEYFAEIGRRGGLKGGKARAAKMTARKRTQIASKAAKARWQKEGKAAHSMK